LRPFKSNLFLLLVFVLASFSGFAQTTMLGKVVTLDDGAEIPVMGANIWWEGTSIGTTSGKDGGFAIPIPSDTGILNVAFVGYQSVHQPIQGRTKKIPAIVLQEGDMLQEIVLRDPIKSTELSKRSVSLSYTINQGELRKAACCNVAESFETNAAVDVSFSDAITGAKRIEMMGLSGVYAPAQTENIPFARATSSLSGMSLIPGPWAQSIHVSKGVGSVVNGFESISGLLDIELKSPMNDSGFAVNAFLNSGGRNELNLSHVMRLSPVISGANLIHASSNPVRWNVNGNGFLDMPLGHQLNAMSRWRLETYSWRAQLALHALRDQRNAGEVAYDFKAPFEEASATRWGMEHANERLSGFGKVAYLFGGVRERSLGLILQAVAHQQGGYYGLRTLDVMQRSSHANLIYQDGNSLTDTWILKAGGSWYADSISSQLTQWTDTIKVSRNERIAGAFLEYTWKPSDRINLIFGGRADYSTLFGWFTTPRVHFRWALTDETILRAHVGSGQRTPNPLIENYSGLASSRTFLWEGLLQRERAWNAGLSLQQDFRLNYHPGSFVFDAFYTWFQQQLVVDVDHVDAYSLYFTSGGYARGLMAQVDYEIRKRWSVRGAYKYLDAKSVYASSGLRTNPMIPTHRGFLNMNYSTKKEWDFDATWNLFGQKRLPDSQENPTAYQWEERSPSFSMVHAQIRKSLPSGASIALGVENALNVRQDNPIIDAANPSSEYFDATVVWGPIFGRMAYLRFDYAF
jgi:outer membrane receptor for ferrienterochelin and colicins